MKSGVGIVPLWEVHRLHRIPGSAEVGKVKVTDIAAIDRLDQNKESSGSMDVRDLGPVLRQAHGL